MALRRRVTSARNAVQISTCVIASIIDDISSGAPHDLSVATSTTKAAWK
jgi:hypothetical protein